MAELPPVKFSSLVYAIPPAPHVRKNSLVITAGPVGGGGLGIYGALHGQKIYTIYLPMPGGNWTLQYCARAEGDKPGATESHSGIVNLGGGLLAPEADAKFDFVRTPVEPEKENKLIILHGILDEDGNLSELKVFQALDPVLDEIALTAFGRWKFKPAMRAGKPAPVEILVGIPARGPKKSE
ncbi:MAG: energy transducer TonB [Candidatus Acidiferrales bacterium]